MLPDWKRIRDARSDITDWLIHWTSSQRIDGKFHREIQILQIILQCGYLKPTFAPRSSYSSYTVGSEKLRIHGPQPAVCFTDQTLRAFIQSYNNLDRYKPYAIAFEKRNLYTYGARPVIYSDENMLVRLKDGDKYLWVHYQPYFNELDRKYPIDWTHEREWRARVNQPYCGRWGFPPAEGVPLVLPSEDAEGRSVLALPWILVRTFEDATKLREGLNSLPEYGGENHFIKHLYANFNNLNIIPLTFVIERLKAGGTKWGKLETLPVDEIPH
jgi:hypothetical protein